MSVSPKTQKTKHRYNRISSIYDFIDKPMEHMFGEYRKNMLKEAYGKVLEVGAGTRINFEAGTCQKQKANYGTPYGYSEPDSPPYLWS